MGKNFEIVPCAIRVQRKYHSGGIMNFYRQSALILLTTNYKIH